MKQESQQLTAIGRSRDRFGTNLREQEEAEELNFFQRAAAVLRGIAHNRHISSAISCAETAETIEQGLRNGDYK